MSDPTCKAGAGGGKLVPGAYVAKPDSAKQITTDDLAKKELINHLMDWISDNEEDANSDCPWTSYTYFMLGNALEMLTRPASVLSKKD